MYFTILVEVFTNHIFAKNRYFTNHIECTENKIAFLKPAHKYQIAQYVTILKTFYWRFPASSVLRWNDRLCTVWVPKLGLDKKICSQFFCLCNIILLSIKHLHGKQVSKLPSNCSVLYCSSILSVSYVFLFIT